MLRLFAIVIAFAAVLASGLIQGWMTGRWRTSPELEPAVAAVVKVPLNAGEWQGKTVDVDEEPFGQTGALSYWTRVYHGKSGTFTVILMCGKAGQMAVHTPDVCYPGMGFVMIATPSKTRIDNSSTFWTAIFRKQQASATTHLRLYWAWAVDGHWQAPDQARWTFRGAPFLYKLYVVHETSPENRQESGEDFLRALVPVVNDALFAAESDPRP